MIAMPDTIKLVETTSDGYGDNDITELTDLKCAFFQSTSFLRGAHGETIDADAHAYIDFSNPKVAARSYRLEGMYVIANPFGAPEAESWYRITRVDVAQRKLLGNAIDNVHVYLKKVEAL